MIKDKPILIFIAMALFLLSLPRVCAQNSSSMSSGEAAISRQKMIDYSKKFIGCPYASGAVGPDSFDCSGFIFTVSRESIGIQLPRTTKAIYSFCKEISDEEREAGDLVFFKTTSSGNVSHVGLYIGKNQFIHCASDGPNTGVIVSSLKESYWKSHYFCTRRYLPSSNSELLTDSSKTKKTETVAADSNQKKTSGTTATTESAASQSFVKSLVADASASINWNFFTPENVRLTWRGLDSMIHVRYEGQKIKPGVGTYIRYDAGTGNLQLPLVISLTLNEYMRIFAGPVFYLWNPSLPGDSSREIKHSIFPGILGICWNTPSFKAGKTEICFAQDIHYTIFNDTDNSALSAKNSIPTGLVFASGIRVTLPLRNVL